MFSKSEHNLAKQHDYNARHAQAYCEMTSKGENIYTLPQYSLSMPSQSVEMPVEKAPFATSATHSHSSPFRLMMVRCIFWTYVTVLTIVSLAIIVNYKTVLAWLRSLSLALSDLRFLGVLVCVMLTVITSFPFIFGYAFSIFLFGLTYPFPWSFIPAYLATVLGGTLAFIACQALFRKGFDISRFVPQQQHLSWRLFAKDLVKDHPIKFLLILRLAPLPFNLLNLICATLPVDVIHLRHFIIALSVISVRIVLTLYIASTVSDLAATAASTSTTDTITNTKYIQAKWIELGVALAFFALFFVFSSIFYVKMKKKWYAPPIQELQLF